MCLLVIIIFFSLPLDMTCLCSSKTGGCAFNNNNIAFWSVTHHLTAKFKVRQNFFTVGLGQTAKFKDRQYFQLYGIAFSALSIACMLHYICDM